MIPYPAFRSILLCACNPSHKLFLAEVREFDGLQEYAEEAELNGILYRAWLYQQKNTISTVRQFTGWSRARFSREFGIYAKTIEAWEKGTAQPRQWVIDLIAYAVICGGITGENTGEEKSKIE